MTLYFAKLNLISTDIFDLYNDPKKKDDITFALYEAVKSDTHWFKENNYFDDSGEPQSTTIDYSIHILRINETATIIEGWLYKKSRLYYKTLDNATKTLMQQFTENTEGNRFSIDLNHGFVGYNTSQRFGYKEFVEAFENIINLSEEKLKYDYRYRMSLCVSGINLEQIKEELHNIGEIKELRIRMQPPNPSDQILDDLQKRCDGVVKNLKDANVTEVEMFYSTKGSSGIDLRSSLISERIDDIQGLYSGLTVEESTQKGYVSVEATSMTGRKYASGDSKPIKRIIEGIEDFFDACVDVFLHLK